ncbi:short-chain alcohol dehydrogenase [Fusarium beomiforme]|uniref:Short-chain alcohol dehydrogenase n=1 Tax=Fusarium beomiforme TaxID=44412 RepID=A0A9P5AIJ5_9HYPO|nr:short-chain alcohol dehydrogenase [Fusarium beomiforme]
MLPSKPTLLCIGCGPGISRSVTALFAAKRYEHVALIAQREESLEVERAAILEATGHGVDVRTYALDITQTEALLSTITQIEKMMGSIECVIYNAARVHKSSFFEYRVEDIEYDFKISVSVLYVVAKRLMPGLLDLAEMKPAHKPALIVTSSVSPVEPKPDMFALSLAKAAQRNLVHSLSMTYGPRGVQIGVINDIGFGSPEDKERTTERIAQKTWEWLNARGHVPFEVQL